MMNKSQNAVAGMIEYSNILYDKVGGGGTRELLHQTQEQFQQV
jgi:peptidase E